MPSEQVSSSGSETPIGRAGQPADLAPAYVFLASQESSYVTGERVGVTGGCRCPDLRAGGRSGELWAAQWLRVPRRDSSDDGTNRSASSPVARE
jgi:hypothetical protein